MSLTWRSDQEPAPARPGLAGWLRLLARGGAMAVLTFGGLLVLLALRPAERWRHGAARPWTGRLVQAVCRGDLRILGLPVEVAGRPMAGPGASVANHASWLDILVLNAADRVHFVAKSEVAGWPGIGWLARATGTVFIARDPREAPAQAALFTARLRGGERLLFFPEGTSTDGRRVLPFKPTLFAAFFAPGLEGLAIQPVSVRYTAPAGADPRFYGWWGDMDLGPHLMQVLAARRQGRVRVVFHPPLPVAEFAGRKPLAAAAEAAVRAGVSPVGR